MRISSFAYISIAAVCLAASGFFDGRAFTYTARYWAATKIEWAYLAHSIGSNLLWIIFFHASVACLSALGVQFAAVQVLIWFTVALATMAILSGALANWPWDVRIAFLVTACLIGWIIHRTANV